GSDLAWIAKPPAGTTCPAASSFKQGVYHYLKNTDGSDVYAPVPARQVDSSTTGWVITTPSYTSANYLTLFNVTEDPNTGNADLSSPASVSVPSYSFPPSAPQAGVTKAGTRAMPLETRIYLSNAYLSINPKYSSTQPVIWTAHTVSGGAGSEVRWYEVNPLTHALVNSGVVSDPSLYVYNGSIAPDRLVKGAKTAFGDSAVISVNTSSSTSYTAIQMAGVKSGAGTSPLVMVKQSTGTDMDYSCSEPYATACRWGDYSGATPDPGATVKGALTGGVWLGNQWNLPTINDETPVWQTVIFRAQP
ncbi:MAG: hypothetical protein ACHQT9_03405, partial [Candidatus Saccharimonadales bacterium]